MTRKDLAQRVNACTGVSTPRAQRTATQQRNLRDVLAVTGVQEEQLVAHLAWGTFTFRDMVQRLLGGRNPFDNSVVRYQGSQDDDALNAGVQRFRADPAAVAALAYDSDLSGLIVLPTLTLHAKHDPTTSVGMEAVYRETIARAGRGNLLVQVFTEEAEHSRLSDAQYAAALESLSRWALDVRRPTPQDVSELCVRKAANIPGGCHIDPVFTP